MCHHSSSVGTSDMLAGIEASSRDSVILRRPLGENQSINALLSFFSLPSFYLLLMLPTGQTNLEARDYERLVV